MGYGAWVVAVLVVVLGLGAWFHVSHMQTTQAAQATQSVNASSTVPTASSSEVTTHSQTQPSNASNASSASSQTTQAAALPAGEPWETTLPLGDYKYTTTAPEKGYIYLCHVASGGQGAQGTPPWISGNVWYLDQKIAVEGSVSWPNAYYSMTVSGTWRTIKSNGLPTDHPTGTFPIQASDPAYQYDENPNHIAAQNYDYMLPVDPTELTTPDCIYGEVGIMNDGVPLFDGFDAEYRDALAHELQDAWNGHPDQNDVYHDHGFEQGPVKESVSTVVGFAFDGYPITGSLLPDGNYLHTDDLDECHGIVSTIDLDGKEVTMYHYVLTQDFPYTVGCFRAQSYEPKPDASESMGGMEMGSQTNVGQGQGTPPSPPPSAIAACDSKSTGASCTFEAQDSSISGTCQTPPGQSSLACVPN